MSGDGNGELVQGRRRKGYINSEAQCVCVFFSCQVSR